MAAELFDKHPESVLPQAYAIELFHNFSLIHDDIMDEAPLRRGKDTVHKKYNRNTAILSGDVMLVWAYEYLLKHNPAKTAELIKVFNQTAMEVCEGQQLDMEFEQRMPTVDEYIEMITLKTAVLLGGALRIGALLSEAVESDAKHLYEFGTNTGIAFQLLDDLLDSFGTAESFGKRIGGDIVQNKKTILLISAIAKANAAQQDELKYWMNETQQDPLKIEAVKKLFKETGAEEAARALVHDYHQKAILALNAIQVSDARKSVLTEFSEMLLQRIH
jgi:geranylgeranyl diphosphate synthase type II